MSAPLDELSGFASQNCIDAETIHEEFPSLKDIVYVDHAATTLVSKTQLDKHRDDVLHNLYGNPHSRSPSSQLATDTIDQLRFSILKFFNTSSDEYTVIFTAGCTASIKLLAESFCFHSNQGFTSVQTGQSRQNVHLPDLTSIIESDHRIKEESDHRTSSISDTTSLNRNIDNNKNNARDTTAETEYDKNEQSEVICQGSCYDGKKNSRTPYFHCGSFTYLLDNHTSVQGMREFAVRTAGKVQCIDCDEHFNFVPSSFNIITQHTYYTGIGNHLFVYPAQSNFNGTKYPLDWISKVKDVLYPWQQTNVCSIDEIDGERKKHATSHWYVCLDAASLVSTSVLDLHSVKPDFVTLSFYKMFGFPTGLGALIVKNTAASVLEKTYFGGGTVSVSLPCKPFHVSRSSLSERFEDGTLPFLDIIALKHGFEALTSLAGGMTRISNHTFNVAQYFYNKLSSCYHGNGAPLAELYCIGDYSNIQTQGGIVNFNILRSNGDYVGFAEVDKLAHLFNIHLRTGCFCNIGACQKYLKLTDEQIKNNFKSGHVCGDNNDLIDGKPTGSVRISFGYMSTIDDAKKCLQFLVDCFLENTQKPVFWTSRKENHTPVQKSVDNSMSYSLTINKSSVSTGQSVNSDIVSGLEINRLNTSYSQNTSEDSEFYVCHHKQLKEICLYPVKSCGAFKVSEWQLGPRGLMFDREWMIVTESGIAMSQKREKNLCLIKPSIDLDQEILTLSYPGIESIKISMKYVEEDKVNTYMCNSKVCGDRVQSLDCGQEAADWLSEALQRPGCRLLRQKQDDTRTSKLAVQGDHEAEKSQLSLANECQYLLISEESVKILQEKLLEQFNENFDLENLEDRFRANLLVSGTKPFEEDSWVDVQIGMVRFKSQGVCTRCQMVCLDQQTGDKNKSPLQVLTSWRNRKTSFGVLLCSDITHDTPVKLKTIRVGDPVFV